ncbi:MAG: hypothetical protein AAF604_19750 [Acidobacteriota bacterium]
MSRRSLRFVSSLAIGFLLGACRGPEPVAIPGPFETSDERTLVVFVPGVTGSLLTDAESGEVLWGTGSRLLLPRDGGYALARSIASPPSDPRVVAPRILSQVRLAGVTKPIYGPIVELLETAGYRTGELARPDPQATLFPFPYDWRQDNVVSARQLFDQLDRLRRARGLETLRVALVCQSNGAHICRYLSRFGEASLEDVEAGRGRPPSGLDITRLVLVGSANGGSLRILRELDRGRVYLPLVGRSLHPEVLFTFPSLYQELPAYRERDFFLDADGNPLAIDLWDAAEWERYGWSVFGRRAAARLQRDPRPELFGDAGARRRFLQQQLDRAKRFQAVLKQDPEGTVGGPMPPIFLLQNAYRETPDRAVLRRHREGWRLQFTGDRWLKSRSYLRYRATAPGDEHATRDSQLWLSRSELAALAAEPFYIRGGHFELILEAGTKRRLLEFLIAPTGSAGATSPHD